MPSFQLPEGAYSYRPLKYGDAGWDVYALQTALNVFAEPPIIEDGVFGDRTKQAVTRYQRHRDLVADGIAGTVTQRTLALGVRARQAHQYPLPEGLAKGQIEKESAFQLGNHTALYERDNSRDEGIIQINDKAKGVTPEQAFAVPYALALYAESIKEQHDRYLVAPLRSGFGRVSDAVAWRYAAGSWNRPAHAAYLAGMRGDDPIAPSSRTLSTAERVWIEGYMNRVTTYVTNWNI